MLNPLYDVPNFNFEESFTFFYQGTFENNITLEIIDLSEYNNTSNAESLKLQKRKSIVLVECVQNIEKYRLPNSFEDSIYISYNKKGWSIISKNTILSTQIEKLEKTLNNTINKTSSELDISLTELLHLEENGKQSAGIGFIQMAKKTNFPLEYSFSKIDETSSSFTLYIHNAYEKDFDGKEHFNSFVKLTNLYEQHTGILYEGKFSNKSMIPILQLIEKYLSNPFSGFKIDSKKDYIIIEMLQNLAIHGLKEDGKSTGVFFLQKEKKGGFKLATCNRISNSSAAILNKYIAHLLLIGDGKREEVYNKKMKSDFNINEKGAKLGLIDIIKYSSPEKVKYTFLSESEKKYFYLETQF